MRDTVLQISYSMPSALPFHHVKLKFLVTSFPVNCILYKDKCPWGMINKMSACGNRKNAIKWIREQQTPKKHTNAENNAQKEDSKKQEQRREGVLDSKWLLLQSLSPLPSLLSSPCPVIVTNYENYSRWSEKSRSVEERGVLDPVTAIVMVAAMAAFALSSSWYQ